MQIDTMSKPMMSVNNGHLFSAGLSLNSAASSGNEYSSIDEFKKNNNVLKTIPIGYEVRIHLDKKNWLPVWAGFLDMNNDNCFNNRKEWKKNGFREDLIITSEEPRISIVPADIEVYLKIMNGNTVVTRKEIREQVVKKEEWTYEMKLQNLLSKKLTKKDEKILEEKTLTEFSRELFPGKPDVNWAIDLIGRNLIIYQEKNQHNQPPEKQLDDMLNGLEKGEAHRNAQEVDVDESKDNGTGEAIYECDDWLVIRGLKVPVKKNI